MKKLDLLCAWGILLIESGHILTVTQYYEQLVYWEASEAALEHALWWICGGMAYVFGAGVNLVRIGGSERSPAFLKLCVAINGAMLFYVGVLVVLNTAFLWWARMPLVLFVLGELVFSLRDLRTGAKSG